MNVALMKESKFLRKEDVGDGTILTIRSLTQENVAMAGAEPELKWCLHFDEVEKPLVTNGINAQMIAKLHGDETEDWTGKKVCLWNDESVSFGGRVVGGIRVRAVPKTGSAPAPRQSAPAVSPVSAKAALKQKIKQHPAFLDKTMTADAVNGYMINRWGAKLDELQPDAAQEALDCFEEIVEHCSDDLDIPF